MSDAMSDAMIDERPTGAGETILVTGANGFVGGHLCRALAHAGYRVRGSLRRPTARRGDGIDTRISGDIDETTEWAPLLEGVDAVVHAAARVHVLHDTAADPLAAFCRVNVAGTERLACQARAAGVRRLIFLSSIGAAVAERAEDRQDAPGASPYQLSKWRAEQALARLAALGGVQILVLRPPLIYGPGAPGHFALLLRALRLGLPLPLASIDNRRSLLFVGNLADAVRACLADPRPLDGIYEVCDREPVSTPELAGKLARALGRPARLLPCPPAALRVAGRLLGRGAAVEGLTGSLLVDSGAFRARFAWHPPHDLDDALRRTVTPAPASTGPRRSPT